MYAVAIGVDRDHFLAETLWLCLLAEPMVGEEKGGVAAGRFPVG
jgi:hypothetical protein